MNKQHLTFLLLVSFHYALFAQNNTANEKGIIIAVTFNPNDILGAHPSRPKNERYPVVLTMPNEKLVWLGGIFDRHRDFNFKTSASFPYMLVKFTDSIKFRIRASNMRNKKIKQWESQVYFDTTYVLPNNIANGSLLLINRTLNGIVSFEWKSPDNKKYSWFIRRESNGIWDGAQFKTFVKDKYVPEQLKEDERFKTD